MGSLSDASLQGMGGDARPVQLLPSMMRQPKFVPAPVPAGSMSTSSTAPCPTSPNQKSPVARSNDIRHGLRTPIAKISLRPPTPDAYGLPGGIAYGFAPPLSTSMRRILPSSVDLSCPLPMVPCWSLPPPPSPMPM